jgi:Core histone H2A/H2B/H3/H4
MISAEAPVLFAKACEIFIIELTHRAWQFTEEGKRRTLQVNSICDHLEKRYRRLHLQHRDIRFPDGHHPQGRTKAANAAQEGATIL